MRMPCSICDILPRHRSKALAVLAATAVGCGGPASEPAPVAPPQTQPAPAATKAPAADPDDVPIKEADVARPKDYADAVTRIGIYRDTIRDEIAAGRPTKAHRALDELDIVLKWLPGVARDSGVPKERWESVNTTAKEIRGLFDKVHSRIDAKQDPNYGSESAAIDKAIASLQGLGAGSKPAAKP